MPNYLTTPSVFVRTLAVLTAMLCPWINLVAATGDQDSEFEKYTSMTITTLPDGSEIRAVMPPEREAEFKKGMQSMQERGFAEKLDEFPRSEYVKDRINERRESLEYQRLPIDAESLGYYDISNVSQAYWSELPFYPSLLPKAYRNSGNASYLMPSPQRQIQLHTDTKFGSVLIDEFRDAEITVYAPNIEVAGEPAKFGYIKHRGNKWATVLFVPHGKSLIIAEADRKLEGSDKQKFIQMVEELAGNVVD